MSDECFSIEFGKQQAILYYAYFIDRTYQLVTRNTNIIL